MISPVWFQQTMLRLGDSISIVPELRHFLELYEAEMGVDFTEVHEITMSHSPDYDTDPDSVLIPFSGGIASTACLWWALRQELHPWLLFVDGFAGNTAANLREREAVKSIFLGTRGPDGLPLWDNPEDRNPRLITLPAVQSVDSEAPKDCQYHAVDLGLLCFLVQSAARAHGCSRIIWGAFGRERAFIEAMGEFLSEYEGSPGINLTTSIFPLDSREQALVLLKEAESLAELLWQTADSDQLTGAALPRNVSKMVYSCFDTAGAENCPGCLGCQAWQACGKPIWQWTTNRCTDEEHAHELGEKWTDVQLAGMKRVPGNSKRPSRKKKVAKRAKARGKKAPIRKPIKKAAPKRKVATPKAKKIVEESSSCESELSEEDESHSSSEENDSANSDNGLDWDVESSNEEVASEEFEDMAMSEDV